MTNIVYFNPETELELEVSKLIILNNKMILVLKNGKRVYR